MLSSKNNPRIKELRKMLSADSRKKNGLFIIEGLRLLEDALTADIDIREIYYCSDYIDNARKKELLEKAISKKIHTEEITPDLMGKLSDTINPQGVMGIAGIPAIDFDENILYDKINIILLEDIQDPGNFGTIIRTAAAAGVEAVCYTSGCVDPYNSKVIRASMGAVFRTMIFPVETESFILSMKANGFQIIATSLQDAESIYDVSMKEKNVFIFGSEAHGLKDNTLKMADSRVIIPLYNGVESLNVSTACGIVLFERLRRTL